MIINEITTQNMSVALVHYIYRDTVIEDYHSECVIMDGALYEIIYKVVRKNLSRAKRFYPVFKRIKEPDDVVLLPRETFSSSLAKEFLLFAAGILMLNNTNAGWDDAKEIEWKNFKKPAEFVLNGVFKEYCDNHVVLDDKAMCEINKDINNRVYTLLCSGFFD
ncbi:MAG: hypothetical protein E7598_03280 [Ruminococcaceae bacterium]|nr:hypothetical protein [Oscillospiraceae bacterium]